MVTVAWPNPNELKKPDSKLVVLSGKQQKTAEQAKTKKAPSKAGLSELASSADRRLLTAVCMGVG